MTAKNGVTQYKLEELKCDVDSLRADVRKVLENHLPHLHEEVLALKTRVNVLSLVNVGALIAGILIAKYL